MMSNDCSDCTLCCDLFYVEWLDKAVNVPCEHCDEGCLIQDTKPKECSDFDCAYIQAGGGNVNLRPNKCGIIFEKQSDRIFFGTLVPDMEVSDAGHGQIQSFLKQEFSVVLSLKNSKHFMISDKHNKKEIRAEFNEIVNGYL